MSYAICPTCNEVIDTAYCPECGHSAEDIVEMQCGECGEEFEPDEEFQPCPSCGATP